MKILLMSSVILIFSVLCADLSIAAVKIKSPMFAHGFETFTLLDQTGKTPQFRILEDSVTKQALALVLITALNEQKDVQPKIPQHSYIDLKVETLKIESVANNPEIFSARLKLSGYWVDLGKTFDRTQFLQGKQIDIDYPKSSKTVASFDIDSSGHLKMHFDPKTNVLILEEVRAKIDFDTPLGNSESESIRFTGRGIRN